MFNTLMPNLLHIYAEDVKSNRQYDQEKLYNLAWLSKKVLYNLAVRLHNT